MFKLLRLKLSYYWFMVCYALKCKKLPINPYIESKNGTWKTSRSDLGLLMGNMLLRGPVYFRIDGEIKTYFDYHILDYHDIRAYVDYCVKGNFK